ncbi:reverse transcriptase domain-containing protein [Tanacetum coccineum]
MHCTARGNIAHNFLRLKEGSIYSVKIFTVQANKDDFRLLRFAHFMLELDGDTVVRKSSMSSDGFDRYPFQFVEFDSLEPTNNKYLIDVVGYVTNVGRTTQQKSGSKTLDFHLANNRGQSVRVTLWGRLGDMLIEKQTRHVGLYPIVLTAMSVKLYNNRLYLSSTSSTLMVDDEQIPVLKRLKTDDSGMELTKEMMPLDSTEAKAGTLENLLMWAQNHKYDVMDYPVIRYRLELEISDATAEAVVVMFDKTAKILVKCSASSIVGSEDQEEGNSGLPPVLVNIVVTSHTLELKSHTYFEHGNYESFTCWKVIEEEDVVETGSFRTVAATANPKAPVLKSLAATPSVTTPSNPSEAKKPQRDDIEDSYVEESSVADSKTNGGDVGCSSDTRKRKSMEFNDTELTSHICTIGISNKGSGQDQHDSRDFYH